MHIEDKTLFQLQAELIDTKVELAVNKAINQVVEQIMNLRHEVHKEMSGLRHEMHEMKQDMLERLSTLEKKVENRLSPVETALGMRNEVRGEIRTRFFDLTYKLGALVAVAALANIPFMLTQIHPLFQ